MTAPGEGVGLLRVEGGERQVPRTGLQGSGRRLGVPTRLWAPRLLCPCAQRLRKWRSGASALLGARWAKRRRASASSGVSRATGT